MCRVVKRMALVMHYLASGRLRGGGVKATIFAFVSSPSLQLRQGLRRPADCGRPRNRAALHRLLRRSLDVEAPFAASIRGVGGGRETGDLRPGADRAQEKRLAGDAGKPR